MRIGDRGPDDEYGLADVWVVVTRDDFSLLRAARQAGRSMTRGVDDSPKYSLTPCWSFLHDRRQEGGGKLQYHPICLCQWGWQVESTGVARGQRRFESPCGTSLVDQASHSVLAAKLSKHSPRRQETDGQTTRAMTRHNGKRRAADWRVKLLFQVQLLRHLHVMLFPRSGLHSALTSPPRLSASVRSLHSASSLRQVQNSFIMPQATLG